MTWVLILAGIYLLFNTLIADKATVTSPIRVSEESYVKLNVGASSHHFLGRWRILLLANPKNVQRGGANKSQMKPGYCNKPT